MEWVTLTTGSLLANVLLTTAVIGMTLTIYRLVMIWRCRVNFNKAIQQFPSPEGHWFWGNTFQMKSAGSKSFVHMFDWARMYGHTVAMYVTRFLPKLLLVHHSSAQVILNTSEPKARFGDEFLESWIGDGLLVSTGQKWIRNRRLLTPAFHFDILKKYVPLFSDSAQTLAAKWKDMMPNKDGQSLEMFHHISLLTLDTLLKCIFSVDSNCQTSVKQHPYIVGVKIVTELIVERARYFPYHFSFIYNLTKNGRKFYKWCSVIHDYSEEVISRRKTERVKENSQPAAKSRYYRDFLDILLDARDDDGKGLSDLEIRHEVDTFMFEGHDTTASGLSWCLHNLASNQHCQERCREEINDLLQDRNNVTWEDVSQHQFPYLTQCIKESMRLCPPVPIIMGRQTTRPHTLPDGKVIPPNTWAVPVMATCHRDESVWPNPDEFDPDRFSQDNSKDRPSHAYIPFSAGPRNCIGQHFAMLEMKTVLAVLLKNFTFGLDENKPPAEALPEIVMRAKHGIWLLVKPVH